MKITIAYYVEKLTGLFWVLPIIIASFIVAVLFPLISLQGQTDAAITKWLMFKATSDGARELLGSIATALMTVVGVLFSITIVVLQQVSSQYTPRVMGNLHRSQMAQTVLGLYVGTFIYCLLLMSNIGQKGANAQSISQSAVMFAIILAIICLLFLILYIHHVGSSIQSSEVILKVKDETLNSLKNYVSDFLEWPEAKESAATPFANTYEVSAPQEGYLEAIHWKVMCKEIKIDKWKINFLVRPGDYIQKFDCMMTISTPAELSERHKRKLYKYFRLDGMRSYAQDPLFGILKLSDIALKGLSPGINDPSTAIESLHAICSILLEYVRNPPDKHSLQIDEEKVLTFNPLHFRYFLKEGYDQILAFSGNHKPVQERIYDDLLKLRRHANESFQFEIDLYLKKIDDLKRKGGSNENANAAPHVDRINNHNGPYQHN